MDASGFLAQLQQLLGRGQMMPQQVGDLLGFGGASGDQTGSGAPGALGGGMPWAAWMRLQGLDPSQHGYDFPSTVPAMRMRRTYPQWPANESMNALPPGLLSG